jgi:hypothetical protein
MWQGRIDNTAQYQQGGVVQLANLYPVGVQEIVRCTALAIRRRAELLGPLSKYDPLNKQLLATLGGPVGQRNHWSQAYVDIELAAAMLANGQDAQALPVLTRATVAGGEFDHYLTATALLELGKIALRQGNNSAAAKAFFEATIAAAHNYDDFRCPDLGVLEEAFRYAALAQLLANQKGVFPPLVPAAQWAKVKGLRQLRVSLLLSAAEGMLVAGQTQQAAATLDDAQTTMARRSMALGRMGARLSFLRATVLFQQRRIDLGDQALAAAMDYMRRGSLWLFGIAQVDASFLSSQLTSRAALDLYQEILRDPQPLDWAVDPMESLAVLMAPHPQALEHWFLAALQRTDREAAVATALEISERARRHRFFSSLALGGRLHALRWILEGPPETLDKKTSVQRQELLADFPAYQVLHQQVDQTRQKLAKLPLVPRDADVARTQSELLVELGKLSLQQEAILREMAVRREPAALVFPPLRTAEELRKQIPSGTAVLAFFVANGKLHGFLLNREKCVVWVVKAAAQLDRRITALLREMGNFEGNRELTLKELADGQWRKSAREILDLLLEGSPADFTKKFPDLVVVPDGILWYLPFEALQVSVGDRLQPLVARFRIRYAPTLALGLPDGRPRRPLPRTALVLGRLYPRETDAAAEASYKEIAKIVPDVGVLGRSPLPASSALYKTQMDQLIVLDDLGQPEQGPYSWAPIQVERGKPGNALGDWLGLPWGGPEVVVLPGFHTPAENALKRVHHAGAGAEVFLSLCGLMSCGARTVLVSRWRTGGQSSVDLVSEFVQELPHTTPPDAWQRAVMVVADSRLSLEAEPRVKKSANDQAPKGNHPFFWAGYMLADSGTLPTKAEKGEPEVEPPPPKSALPAKGEAQKAPDEGPPKKIPPKKKKREKTA